MWVDYWGGGGGKGYVGPPLSNYWGGGAWPPLFLRLCRTNDRYHGISYDKPMQCLHRCTCEDVHVYSRVFCATLHFIEIEKQTNKRENICTLAKKKNKKKNYSST